MKDSFGSAEDTRRKITWAVLFVFIAALSIYAVVTASRGFSIEQLKAMIRDAHPLYVCLAILCMIGFIVFEGLALRVLIKSFGHRCRLKDCIKFSAADIYFSAITPSATGGQPACAYFMVKSGIPTSCTTVSLVFNLALYTFSIIIIGAVCFIIHPGIYFFFRPITRVIIVLGAVTLLLLTTVFILFILKRSLIDKAGSLLIKVGSKLNIIKNKEEWEEKLDSWTEEYMQYADQIWIHKKDIAIALLFNVLQRACQMAVTMFMYIAVNIGRTGYTTGRVFANGAHLLGAQSLITIGATYIPVPGAMGFTDLMMLDGFSTLMPESQAAALELLSRSISFYSCVIICFIIVVAAFLSRRDSNEED